MKAMEFVRSGHDFDKICRRAVEVYEHIRTCKTRAQWLFAKNYVDNWRTLTFHQEHLNEYRGWKKFLCKLFGNTEHDKCINIVNEQCEMFHFIIYEQIKKIDNIDENY